MGGAIHHGATVQVLLTFNESIKLIILCSSLDIRTFNTPLLSDEEFACARNLHINKSQSD